MELTAGRLLADKTEVFFGKAPAAKEQKNLLEQACAYFDGLGLTGVQCALARLSGPRLFSWSSNRALIVEAEVGEEVFQAIVTLNTYGNACVVSCYKQFLDDEMFALTHSSEVRRRVVIDRLQSVEAIDFFQLVDRAVDELLQFVVVSLKD